MRRPCQPKRVRGVARDTGREERRRTAPPLVHVRRCKRSPGACFPFKHFAWPLKQLAASRLPIARTADASGRPSRRDVCLRLQKGVKRGAARRGPYVTRSTALANLHASIFRAPAAACAQFLHGLERRFAPQCGAHPWKSLIVKEKTDGSAVAHPLRMTLRRKNPHAMALGRLGGLKGGRARATKLSARRRRDIARLAANARWQSR